MQESVSSIIVAGRRSEVDAETVHRLFFDRGSKVSLQTYDDVATRLNFYLAGLRARDENKAGLSLHLVLAFAKQTEGDNYVLDLGVDHDRNRISLFVAQDDRLCLRVIDETGKAHVSSVSFDRALILYHVPIYLVVELAFATDYIFSCIEVNGFRFSDRRFEQMVIDPTPLKWHVLGSDVRALERCELAILEFALYSRMLNVFEKKALREYALEKHQALFNGSTAVPAAALLSGRQCRPAEGHPNFELS